MEEEIKKEPELPKVIINTIEEQLVALRQVMNKDIVITMMINGKLEFHILNCEDSKTFMQTHDLEIDEDTFTEEQKLTGDKLNSSNSYIN